MRPFLAALLGAGIALMAASAAAAAGHVVGFDGLDGQPLQGFLFAPTTPGKHGAIVALHGCSGLSEKDGSLSSRHADWGERWLTAGYVVLFPDSFGSRGLGPQCKVHEREVKPSQERVADANAAMLYLASRPDVDPVNISLIGWSNGGSSTLYAMEPKNKLAAGPDFARAIAFYPGCSVPLKSGRWATRAPLTILMGADDDWTPAAPCVELMTRAKASGQNAEIVTYPGAYHDFDHPNLPVHTVEGLAFTANDTGVAHTGTNPAARADAIQRVMALLKPTATKQ